MSTLDWDEIAQKADENPINSLRQGLAEAEQEEGLLCAAIMWIAAPADGRAVIRYIGPDHALSGLLRQAVRNIERGIDAGEVEEPG